MGPVTDVPLLERGSPETKQGPAVANPRIRVCSTVVFSAASGHARSSARCFASEPIGRRTLMPRSVETGHERCFASEPIGRRTLMPRSVETGHERCFASEPIGRRTLMPPTVETGHESAQTQTENSPTIESIMEHSLISPGLGPDQTADTLNRLNASVHSHVPFQRFEA